MARNELTAAGTLVQYGDIMTRERLARYGISNVLFRTQLTVHSTLDKIAEHGVETFYEGAMGELGAAISHDTCLHGK